MKLGELPKSVCFYLLPFIFWILVLERCVFWPQKVSSRGVLAPGSLLDVLLTFISAHRTVSYQVDPGIFEHRINPPLIEQVAFRFSPA